MTRAGALRGLPARVQALPRRRRRLVFLTLAVGYVGAFYGVLLLVQRVAGDDPVDWAQPLGPLVGSVAGTSLVTWWQRRRLGGSERVTQFQAALRARRLPDDADPAVWRRLLTAQRRTQRRAVVTTQVLLVVVAAFALSLADLSDAQVVGGLLLAALSAVLVGWWGRRVRRPLEQLIARLPDGRSTPA